MADVLPRTKSAHVLPGLFSVRRLSPCSAIILYTNGINYSADCQQYKISYVKIFFKQDLIDVALKQDPSVKICQP